MKKTFYILLLTIGSLISSGCSDWLEILPNNEQVTADYWKTKEDVEAVLASGYYYMRTTTESLIIWGELRGASIFSSKDEERAKLQNFQLRENSSICTWTGFYQTINMANSVIKYASNVRNYDETYTEAAMKSHQTEAYFIRGLMYFYLLRNFKEVPLVTEPYVDDSAPYMKAKSTEEEIISQIKADIKMALESNAAKEFYDEDWASKGRATKWALYALMADVCLWAEDYDECIIYANNLIEATAPRRPAFMSIPEQWFTMFYPGNSNESIFELNWDSSTYGQTAKSPSNYFTFETNAELQYSPRMIERFDSEIFEALINVKDPIRSRFGACVLGTSTSSGNEIGFIWKYMGMGVADITAVRLKNDANFIIYRMADVMLMKAEALIWKGSASWQAALDIINQIRVRSNLKPLDVNLEEVSELDMLTILLNERDIEFAAEGKRWYDLVRFGKSQNYKYQKEFISMIVDNNSSVNDSWIQSVLKNEYAWYLPIHEDEIEVNSLLVQNPYYDVTKK